MTRKLLFIHHSTGANLIYEGNLREKLKKRSPNIEFWDHSYNLLPLWQITARIIPYQTGLSDMNGRITGTDYAINITNTDPQGYADLFSQPIRPPINNAFSKIVANFDTIMFKSCFPVTKIESDEQLNHYQECYLTIRNRIDKFPGKLFLLFTPPPLRKEMTRHEYAKRAREFSRWMKSSEYLGARENVAVFDFFDILAENNPNNSNLNMLKSEYCRLLSVDSHPNKRANEEATAELVTFITEQVKG